MMCNSVTPDNDNAQSPAYTDEQVATMVDATMSSMDRDNDGHIDFGEYRLADVNNELGF